MKKNTLLSRLLTLLLFTSLLLVTSCGNDEPEWFVGYYLEIDAQVAISLSDEGQDHGIMPDMGLDVLSNAVRRMRDALLEVYPEDTRTGNDVAVLTACGDIYRKYKRAYSDYEGHTVCVVKLFRAKKDSQGIVRESTPLTVYQFGVLPVNVVPVDF